MKVCVINMVGNIGKSTIAGNLLLPRMQSPKFISVESINSGAEADGVEVEKMKGKQFGELTDELLRIDNAIVDVGSSNADDFLKLMQQFAGSHEDFDFFVVPTVNDKKALGETVKTALALKAIGVDRKRVRIIFNKVQVDDDVMGVFAPIFGLAEVEKCCTVNPRAVIYENEVFQRIKDTGTPLGTVMSDQTDYRAALREAKTEEEKERCIAMISLKRLAVSASKNLDDAYAALFANK